MGDIYVPERNYKKEQNEILKEINQELEIQNKQQSQSKILRSVFFKIYEGLSLDYRKEINFQTFYETEMQKIINEKKTLI